MEKTQYYQLNKPEAGDPIRISDFNANADAIDAALAGCARVECGTYNGTHTYGEDNPCTLTFSIEPKIVFIFDMSCYGSMADTSYTGSTIGSTNQVFYSGGNKFSVYSSESGSVKYTLSGNTLTWYTSLGAWLQMNGKNTTYGYIAIG